MTPFQWPIVLVCALLAASLPACSAPSRRSASVTPSSATTAHPSATSKDPAGANNDAAAEEARLPPCPDTPNCVSSQSPDPKRAMPPLPYQGSRENSRRKLIALVESMPRSRITRATERHIHAEFRSAVFRFVDDVDFVFDDAQQLVHFRSASRSGYSDLGVNRRRMQTISEAYLKPE
jgi:uncharacterized protein (DUF1499 family)